MSSGQRGACSTRALPMVRPGERRGSHLTEAPLAARVLRERRIERRLIEVRPRTSGEVQLRVRALPQQEIAEPLLAAGTDEEVDLRHRRARVIHGRELREELLAIAGGRRGQASTDLEQAVLAGVIHRDAQMQTLTAAGGLFAALDEAQQIAAQAIAAADHVEANALRQAALGLGDEVTPEEGEERAHLRTRTAPVVRGKGVERQHADAAARGTLDYGIDGLCPGAMSRAARQAAARRPAAVAVHDYCDVHDGVLYMTELMGKKISRGASP